MKYKNGKKFDIKAITLGGVFAAIYFILTILSVYFLPILSIIGLLVMPIFAAYYSSVFNFKYVIVFNLDTLLLCFLGGIGDPFFALLYILPTLIVGDALGILNKTKIKFFTTLFLQSVVYSITNYLALYFGEIFYETKIIGFLISDPIIYENFALSILFILSGAEAIFSSIFTMENLKVLKITKDKEKQMPLYGYIACIIFYFLMILFYFCKLNNLFFLMIIFIIILAIPPFIEINKKIKHPTIIWTTYIIIFTLLNFLLCYLTLYYLIAILMALPLIIYCIVKIIFYIYNIRRKGE